MLSVFLAIWHKTDCTNNTCYVLFANKNIKTLPYPSRNMHPKFDSSEIMLVKVLNYNQISMFSDHHHGKFKFTNTKCRNFKFVQVSNDCFEQLKFPLNFPTEK